MNFHHSHRAFSSSKNSKTHVKKQDFSKLMLITHGGLSLTSGRHFDKTMEAMNRGKFNQLNLGSKVSMEAGYSLWLHAQIKESTQPQSGSFELHSVVNSDLRLAMFLLTTNGSSYRLLNVLAQLSKFVPHVNLQKFIKVNRYLGSKN